LRTKKGHLTPMERTFSDYMARTGDRVYSAVKAGYSSPQQAASQNMQNADVQNDIRRRARNLLQNEGAMIGVVVLAELATDTLQKGSTRGAAAKALVQLSGVSSAATLSEADLAELPADKIRALLAEAQRALEARMANLKTIDHEPAESVESAQAAPNMFD
jgi:hypothetical protein